MGLKQHQGEENGIDNNNFSDSKPCHHWSIDVKVTHAVHLLATIMINLDLYLFTSLVVRLCLRLIDQTDGITSTFWGTSDLLITFHLRLSVINVTIDFLYQGLHKFFSIRLLQCLVEVHYVSHHFSMKCYRVAHSLLEAQMLFIIPDELDLRFPWITALAM